MEQRSRTANNNLRPFTHAELQLKIYLCFGHSLLLYKACADSEAAWGDTVLAVADWGTPCFISDLMSSAKDTV